MHSQRFDFFTADTLWSEGPNPSPWTAPEFSYRTNPNSKWYAATPGHTGYEYRFNQQRLPSSLVVRIKEQHNDYDPTRLYRGPHMIVDFLSAPYENVVYPNGGEILRSDEPVTIEWETTFAEITTVDILYLRDVGGTDPDTLTIATGIAASAGEYEWYPGPEHASNTAKIMILYHHDLGTTYVGDDTSDATFCMLGASKAVFDNKDSDSKLAYTGTPYSSVGFDYNYDAQAPRNFEDLMITIASGGLTSVFNRPSFITSNGVPWFDDVTEDAFTSGIRPQVGLGGVAVADADNDGDLDLFCASGLSATPHMYVNQGNGTFADSTVAWGLDQVATNSWAGAWGDYDRDGWVDLFVTRGGDLGVPPESMTGRPAYLLRNRLDPVFGTCAFEDVTAAAGLSANSANVAASIAACWGDINNDNRLDLYLAEYRLNPAGVCGGSSSNRPTGRSKTRRVAG